jgi:hypothetical protein
MARPPNPTNLQVLKGAFQKDPARGRRRAEEPQPPDRVLELPVRWRIFHPDDGYREAERFRAVWDNCIAMWPWLTFSDQDALEHYCVLKLKQDRGALSGAELTAIGRIRSELGGTGSGRARLGMLNAPAAPSGSRAQPQNPRAAFLARKTG